MKEDIAADFMIKTLLGIRDLILNDIQNEESKLIDRGVKTFSFAIAILLGFLYFFIFIDSGFFEYYSTSKYVFTIISIYGFYCLARLIDSLISIFFIKKNLLNITEKRKYFLIKADDFILKKYNVNMNVEKCIFQLMSDLLKFEDDLYARLKVEELINNFSLHSRLAIKDFFYSDENKGVITKRGMVCFFTRVSFKKN